MNLNISTSNIQNDKNFSTSIHPSFSENCQKSHDSSAQKQLIASCMGADESAFNNYSNSKTYSNVTDKKQIVTNVLVKPEKPIYHSKQIHASNSANVRSRRYNGTNTVKSTFNKYSNLKRYVLSKKPISSQQHSKYIHTPSSAAVLSRPCNGTNIVDPVFNEHSNPKKYSDIVNTQMIANLHSSIKKPILCRSHCKEIHTSNSAAIQNTACNENNIIEPTFNKHSDPKLHSNIIPNKQPTTSLPFLPKESISSLQHAKQIHLTNSAANQNESSCLKIVDVKVLRSSAVFDAKSTNSEKIKTDESSLTKLPSFSLNSLQRNNISISRIYNTSDILNDSENISGLLKRQITRVSDSNLNCRILPLKENNTKADDFIKPNNDYKTVVSINEKKNSQDDKGQITGASQTNLKCIKLHLKENNKNTDTILNTNNEPQVQDDFIKPNNSCQTLVDINKAKNSQDDKRQITSPSQTSLKLTRLSLEEIDTKTDAVSNKNHVPQVQDDFIKPNNSCQAIVSIGKQNIFQDATDIPKKVLCAKKPISSSENMLFNSSCNSSSKNSSFDKTFEKSRKSHRTYKLLKRNQQSQNRHSVEKIKRCSSESVSLPVLHPTIIHLLKNNKETLTIMPVENVTAEYEKDNILKSTSLSPSSQRNSCSLQITLKKHAVEEHSKTECHDSVTDITDCKNSINDSAEASKNIPFLDSSNSPIIFNFDKKPELYEKISKYVSSAVVERKPSEPEVSDNLLHTNKPPRIIRQNIVYTDDREAILRLSTLHEPEADSETKKNTLKNVEQSGISTFCDNESSVIPETIKNSIISSEFTIKLEEVHNKLRYWPKPVIALETIGAFDKYIVSLSEPVTKKNNLSALTNESLTKSKIPGISNRKENFPLSQNFKEIPEKIASHYKILTNVSNAFSTQNPDKNKSNANLNHTSLLNSKPVSINAFNPPSVSAAKMMKNIISCPEKIQTIKNSSEKLPPSLLNSLQKNGISLSSLQKCDISVTNVDNDSKYNSEVFNINSNISHNKLKNEEFSVKNNHAKANKVNQEKNISQIKINGIESNNVSGTIRINHICTRIPYKRKIPATDADANIPNKSVCVRKSSSSSESMLLNKSSNSISKFDPVEKTSEESRNKNYDKLVKSPTQSLFSQNQYKIKEIKELSIKPVPPAALLHTKVVSPVKNSQEPVSSISVQNIMTVNQKFAILKTYLLSNPEKKMFSSRILNMNTINSPSKIKAEDSITNSNVTFNVAGTSDNTPSPDPPVLTTVMNPANDSDLHKKYSSALIEMKPSLPKMSCNLPHANQPAGASQKNIVDFTHDREAPLRMRSLCDPKYRAENTEAKLKNAKQIGISTLCQKQSLVIPEKKEDISLEITIKIKDANKKMGPLERTGVFNEHIITSNYLSKPVPEKIDFTTASKKESLFKVEISKLDEKEKEKCFSSSHNLNEIPENSLSRCVSNEVTSSDCVNGINENVNSKPTEKIPPISENILNDTSFVETIQTNVDNFSVSKTNKIFSDFNKSEALETIKGLQALTTSIVETNDEMISSVYVTGNKNLGIHGINVGSCQAFSETKSGIYSDHSFLENTHEETDKNNISHGISHVKENVQNVDFFSNNTFMPPSGLGKELLENTTLPHIENKNVASSVDNTYTADNTISSENELRNVNSEENLDLQLLHLLLTEVQNTYGKVFLKNFIENCVKSSEWDNRNDTTDKSDKSSYTSDVGEQRTLNQELVLKNQEIVYGVDLGDPDQQNDPDCIILSSDDESKPPSQEIVNGIDMGDPDCIILSSDDESKPPSQSAAQLSKKQKSMNVSTRNMTVSTRNMNATTRNMNVSTRNMNVSTRNMNVSTRNMNASTRNMNVSTKNLSVPRRNVPNANNYLKNIQPANSFQKTNSAAQNFVAPYNRTNVTELPFNKHQNLKPNSNAVFNRQTPSVSVTSKQPISQQQHFKPIRSSNSVPVQYLHNTKTLPNNQLKTVQQSSTKNKSIVNLNHTSQSSSMPVNMKIPNPPSVSNAKTILMKNIVSRPEKTQNSPEKLPPSLLNSLQKNGISVSSLQKCGISVTNVGNDSKTNSELLNRQATVVPQRNLNYAKFSVKEKDAKTNAVPQASIVPQVQNNFIKSNSLCAATIRGNKRKIPPTDAGIPNKSICIRKSNSLSPTMLLNSNCNSAPKIASISKTLEKSQNKTFARTPNSPIRSISSQNQHNVKEIKEWPTKSVAPAVLHTKVVPIVKNPKIVPRENIRAVNQKYDTLKNVSLPSNSQKQPFSSSVVNKSAVNSYSKPKAQVPVANPKSIATNSATSSSNTPFLNSSLSVTVVNPVKKFDLCSQSSQPVISSSMVETKASQSKITNYLTRKNQPLRTNRKSIDLTNREALLSLLALCEPEDYTDTKDTKVKNAKPSDSKITKGKTVKASNSKDSKEKNIEPIVISLDSENESATPEESTKKSNISPKFTIKLKEVYKTIRYWPKPVVVLERINALDNHIVSSTSLSKPVTKKTDISKSKNKLPVTSKTAKKNKGKNEKKLALSRNLKNDPEGIAPQCKNSSITLSDVMKYVDEDFNLQAVENSATSLSENKITLSDAVYDDSSKTVQNSVALLSNNKIGFSEAVNDDDSLKAVENSMRPNNKITLTDTLNDSNCLELVENSVPLLSNNKINFSEAVNDDVSLKAVENCMTSNNKITLTDTLNDSICLELPESSVTQLSNSKITLSEAVGDDDNLKPVENSVMLSNNTNILSDTVNDNNSLKPVENSVAQFSNNVTLSEDVGDDDSLKLGENSVTLSNNTNTLSDTANENNSVKPVESSVAQFSNNKITLLEAVDDDDSLKPVENSVILSNNTNTLSESVNGNNNLKPVENSVAQFSNITLSEAVGDDNSLKLVENSGTLSNNTNTSSDIASENNRVKPVESSVAQFSNDKITLSEAVGDDDSLKPVENSVILSNNTNTLSESVNGNNNLKPVENSVAQFSNITLSEAVGDDDSLKLVENSGTLSNNTNTSSDIASENNRVKPVESSVAQFSNDKITLSEAVGDDDSLKPVENSATLSNNANTLSETVNDNSNLKPVESSVAQFSNDKITLSEAVGDDESLKPVENSASLSNNANTLSDIASENNSVKPVESSVAQFSNDKMTLSEAVGDDSQKPVENSATLSNNANTLSETVNDNSNLKPVESPVAQFSNDKITLSEAVGDDSLKLVENSVSLSNNTNTLSETANDNSNLKPVESSVVQFSNDKITLSEAVGDDDSLKPVENSATLSNNANTLSETVNNNSNLKPVENSVAQFLNNKITLSEVANDDVSLKPIENSLTLSNNTVTLLDTANDNNSSELVVENSVAQFSNNKITLSETENEVGSQKQTESSATLSSDHRIIISEAESEDVSIKSVENSVTSSDRIPVSKAENEEVCLKPVENSVALLPNNKFTLFDIVNDNIGLTPVEISVAQLSNKITLSEVENGNLSLKPDVNSVRLSSSNRIISEAKNKNVSLKPVENSVTLISNNKSILSDMVNDNISLEPIEHSVAQLSNTSIILSETVNDDVVLKTTGNSLEQLSSNSVSLSEVVNDDISLKSVEKLSDNSMTILDELSDTLSLKPIKSIKSTLSEDVLFKSAHTDEDNNTSDLSATERLFHDTPKSDSSEMVKSLLTSTISVVETFDVLMSDISVNGNKNFENNEISLRSCQGFIGTVSGICSDLSSLESMCKEKTEDKISCILNSTNKNIQAAAFISKDSSAVSSNLATGLYNDSANYPAEQSAVSVLISDILKKVESMLADDKTITEVQCKSSHNVMNTSEVIPVLCQKDDSLINHGLLLTDDKTNCSTDNVINNILSSENELHAENSDYKQSLPSTKVQEISDNDIDENLSDKHVKSSLFDDKCDVDDLSYENNKDDLNITLNEAHSDQVTSPKLSLKRNRTELTPDRKLDDRSGVENVSKKIKFDDRVSGTELSNKKPETAISTDTTSTVSADVVPSTSFASTTPIIELSDEEPVVLIVDEEKEFQMISSMNSDAPICNILEERRKKLIRILDFAAPLMPPDTSDEEKKIIARRLLKQLDTAQQSYVESENFDFLLDISFEKIKMKPEGVFTFLNEIKRELKNHKKENKKAIKGSTEDKISLTDDSISKDIFIDSTSSLPSKDKVALGDALHTNFNFASRFKVPEKQEPDSASCSSLTSELTKFFSSNKNIINDSGNNLQTAANSNTKVVSDNLVTDESSSSIIALGWHSVKLNTSKSQSLYNQMSKKFKSAEDNSTPLSKTAIPESTSFPVTSFPVSGNDHENKKGDLSKQSNRRKSIDDSGSNLQTSTSSDKKLIYNHFVTNEFSSSAIASAVGLCSKELKTSKLPSLKDPSKEKLNSTEVAHDASTSGMHLSSASIPEHGVSRNDVNREFDLSSLPSTSRCRSPSDKFLLKNDSSSKMSRSSSTDSLPADRRTLLEKKEDDRNAKRIKKLEKHLKELDRAIKKCQQEDLSLDDLDSADSAYLQESRYKKRFVATYKLLCKLKRVPARTGRIIEKKFHYQGSRYSVINKAIEKLIDSKKIQEKFPDYNEVLNVIKQVQDRDDLGFTEVDISNEAKRVFEDIGEQLKERRWRDQRELMGCYLTDDLDLDEDPAERDDRLKKTLEENSKKFNESINKIIDHYVEKQQQTPAGENDDEEDDAEEDDEKDDDEEETVANIHDDSDDLPGTAPASPENIGGAPVINIIERDDDDIEIINYSDKSTDPEGEVKEKQTLTVNKPNISQSIVLDDSESSEDLPSLQELVDKSKIGS